MLSRAGISDCDHAKVFLVIDCELVSGCKILGQSRHNLAIPSRIHRPGFDHFSDFVRGFSQLLLVKTSAPSQRDFQHVLANLEELKALQKIFEYIVQILGSHIDASYSALASTRQARSD